MSRSSVVILTVSVVVLAVSVVILTIPHCRPGDVGCHPDTLVVILTRRLSS